MIIDLTSFSGAKFPPTDVAIIGAGAVGLLAAKYLASHGFDVLLIESGGMNFEKQAQALNLGRSIGRFHDGLVAGRARVVGGTTTLWGGQLTSFQPIDFKYRPWVPNSGWPLRFDDIAPYYDAVFALLGEKRRPDKDVWRELDIGKSPQLADLDIFLTRWLPKPNFREVFRNELKSNARIRCLIHATAVTLNMDEKCDRVTSATLKSWTGRSIELTAKAFLVANGTIEAIRLLLNSAHADPKVPWRSSTWLGRGFHDHLDCKTALIRPSGPAFSKIFDNIYVFKRKYQPKLQFAPAKQEETKSLNIAASIVFESSLIEQLGNLKYVLKTLLRGAVPDRSRVDISGAISAAKLTTPLIRRYLRDRRAFNHADKGIFLNVHCEQITCSESCVSLDHANIDAMGVPGVRLNWYVDGREIETMALFTETIAKELERSGLARTDILDDFRMRRASALDRARDTYHQGGGLRMGRDAGEGVVDKIGRVFGTQNLYVAGAAVFPTSGHANSTLTAMALTLRTLDAIVPSIKL